MDADGDIRLVGRTDDVVNVSGHRIGTAEIESALGGHASVAESAVVGFPHALKGEGLYCFVILKAGSDAAAPALRAAIVAAVRARIGPIATPDVVHFVPDLPKTRSGKIMRRMLRKIAAGEKDVGALGDVTTLADPSILQKLVDGRAAAVKP
jgi:acetyl-CoA synthetase